MSKQTLASLVTTFLITTTASFAIAFMNPFIVNGRPVKLGENYSQHTVGLGSYELFCSGVIIDSHHVLTAAHCEDGLLGSNVYFGTEATNFEFRKVVAVTPHPQYCQQANCGSDESVDDNDILVVKFEGDLPLGFSPAAIANVADFTTGVSVHLAGFGANEFGRYEDILKVAQVPLDTLHGSSEFKTDELKAGSCHGDSGGPAFIKNQDKLILAGLTSRGDGPCRKYGIYTRVDYFSNWIAEVVQKP